MTDKTLKFRIWDKTNKEWHRTIRITSYGKKVNCQGNRIHGNRAKNLIISQYTGLKDKDEKEIYEGDIVKIVNYFCDRQNKLKYELLVPEHSPGTIKWINGGFVYSPIETENNDPSLLTADLCGENAGCQIDNHEIDSDCLKVIGNTFQGLHE